MSFVWVNTNMKNNLNVIRKKRPVAITVVVKSNKQQRLAVVITINDQYM
jgi:hypothetical protein